MNSVGHRAGGAGLRAPHDQAQYLTFMLGAELFAIGILVDQGNHRIRHLTTVPMMPDCIRGVINLRGAVVPVMDSVGAFRAKPSAMTRRTCIVIIEVNADAQRQVVGLIVDAVNEVLEIRGRRHRARPQLRHGHPHRFHPRDGQDRCSLRHHSRCGPRALGRRSGRAQFSPSGN